MVFQIVDLINQVPYAESHICDFHKRNPGKPFAGCCCRSSFGWRPATLQEKIENVKKRKADIQAQIDEMETRIRSLEEERRSLELQLESNS